MWSIGSRLGVVDQCPSDEVDDRCAHRCGESLCNRSCCWPRYDELVAVGHWVVGDRNARAASIPRTTSPDATAAFALTSSRTASASLRSSSVFQTVQVVRTNQDSSRPTVASDHDSLVFTIDAVDEFREPIFYVAKPICRHGYGVPRDPIGSQPRHLILHPPMYHVQNDTRQYG
jgi:hypothetical protein